MSKPGADQVEDAGGVQILSEEHQQYLLERHGTIDLDPLPHMDDADPLNWPKWKKVMNLVLVAFHSMMATFSASAIQSAFKEISEDLGISLQRTSYQVSLFIAILGGGPLLWRPLSHIYGRRPIFLISLLCSLVGNVGCGVSPTYGTMGLCRAITALFICPAASLGSAVVQESFFRHERARYMGVWTIMVTLGVPVAPFIFGFVALRVGYRWIYWTLALTRYIPTEAEKKPSAFKKQYLSFRRIDSTPLKWLDFVRPLTFAARPNIAIPAAAYAMVFLWGSVMTTFEIPQIYPEKFGLNTQQVGLQYIGIILGTVIGEQMGGILSDKWMWHRERRGIVPQPEYRLWLSYIGHLLTICGIVVFLVQLGNVSDTWTVTPVVGAGIAAAGNQLVTTVMITYAVDCDPQNAAAIGVFITFVRQCWGFIGPFWIPQMIENLGYNRSTAITTATIVGVSMLPTMALQWRGRGWRKHHTEG